MVENIFKSSLAVAHREDMPPGKRKTLEAAILLFSKQGYQGTSTLEIAKAAGVSQATVFKYFKTKEDLLSAILTPVLPHLFLNFLGELKDISSTEAIIHYIVRDRFAFIKENKETIKIILSETLTNESLKKNLLSHIDATSKQEGIEALFETIFKTKDGIHTDLSVLEIVRSIVGPILVYFCQRFIIFDDIPCDTEEHDLNLIERQIYQNLTA